MSERVRDLIVEVVASELHLRLSEECDDATPIGANGLGLDSIHLMHLLGVLYDRTGVDLLHQIADVTEMSLGELVELVDARRRV